MPLSRTRFVTVFLLALVVVLGASATAQAELRNWLVDGETFRGEYEGIQGGNVVLRNGGQQRRIHFYALSEADQQYLRKQLKAAGKADLIPKVGPLRTWTDDEGSTFDGRLIGADEQAAYVLVGSKQYRLPLDELPPADREHVVKTLGQWGITLKPARRDRAPAGRDADDEPPKKNGVADQPSTSPGESPTHSGSPGIGRTGWIPGLSQERRPAYVPPSNKAAALALDTRPDSATITPTGSGGSIHPVLVVLLIVAAVAGLAMWHTAQRAR